MTAATPAIAVVRNDDESRYEIFVDGQVVGFSDYRIDATTTRCTCTPRSSPEFRGRTSPPQLVGAALDDARAHGYRSSPAARTSPSSSRSTPSTPTSSAPTPVLTRPASVS